MLGCQSEALLPTRPDFSKTLHIGLGGVVLQQSGCSLGRIC